jgi:hypothetical protein
MITRENKTDNIWTVHRGWHRPIHTLLPGSERGKKAGYKPWFCDFDVWWLENAYSISFVSARKLFSGDWFLHAGIMLSLVSLHIYIKTYSPLFLHEACSFSSCTNAKRLHLKRGLGFSPRTFFRFTKAVGAHFRWNGNDLDLCYTYKNYRLLRWKSVFLTEILVLAKHGQGQQWFSIFCWNLIGMRK